MYSYMEHQPFNLDQLKNAHAKVKSGADFPAYIRDISKLGIKSYETYVSDGRTVFQGENQFQIASEAKYPQQEILDSTNPDEFKSQLKTHQLGGSDYLTFTKQCAAAGVEKWIVSIKEKTCTYYDKAGNQILTEKIP